MGASSGRLPTSRNRESEPLGRSPDGGPERGNGGGIGTSRVVPAAARWTGWRVQQKVVDPGPKRDSWRTEKRWDRDRKTDRTVRMTRSCDDMGRAARKRWWTRDDAGWCLTGKAVRRG